MYMPSTSSPAKNLTELQVVHILTPDKTEMSHSISPPAYPHTDIAQDLLNLPLESPLRKPAKRKLDFLAPADESPRKKRLKLQIEKSKNELRRIRNELNKSKLMIQQLTVARNLRSLPLFPRVLTKIQLCHRSRSRWDIDEKKVALGMYYKSPSMYKFLRKNKVILPSVSSIQLWLSKYHTNPGINKKIFQRLKIKSETMTLREKKCVLLFDEMAIKRRLEFSRRGDLIEGFEDLGEHGRKAVASKQAMVLMARGVYSDWKIPIAYYFSESGVKASKLKEIVQTNLEHLVESGLEPVAIVCDQSTTNQRLYKLFETSHSKPYFFYKKRKYYAIIDAPHLIKSIRNNLIKSDFLYRGKRISWKIIREVYNLDQQSMTARTLIKLTSKHLNPNSWEKMSVHLATQVFSNTMAAAIRTAIRTKQLHSKIAASTADFVAAIDKLFDALNSRHLYSKKPANKPLCHKNKEVVDALKEGYRIMKHIRKDVTGKKKKDLHASME